MIHHRSFLRRFLSILSVFAALLAGFVPSAEAAGRAAARGTTRTSVGQSGSGSRTAGSGRTAGTTGSGRTAGTTSTGRTTSSTRNVNRNTNVNRNVNVDRDINVDVDNDWDGFDNDWDDHPIAAGVALGTAAAITSAVIGSIVYSVPPGCVPVMINGMTYQQCGGTWYQPQYAGTQVSYIVVNPPQ